ncbi:MAG: glycoside hydrolase family 78 protein [Lachnospiraceae bacterium]|nr:glycoside hydrolase family 78 protein [Lachnospiraceae bacterium]
MLEITKFRIEDTTKKCITDNPYPQFSFSLESDRQGCELATYKIVVKDERQIVWDSGIITDKNQIGIAYSGEKLLPFTKYFVQLQVTDNYSERAEAETGFYTGRMGVSWSASWITDCSITIPEKSSPHPLLFRKKKTLRSKVKKAWVCASALGIYELYINEKQLDDRYFAPGFTNYNSQIQYQIYDVTDLLKEWVELDIKAQVGGGWAVGAFTFTRHNQTYADTPAFLFELHILYENDEEEILGSDASWQVSQEGRLVFADWYDGEVYDARIDDDKIFYRNADIYTDDTHRKIVAEYGAPVRCKKVLSPLLIDENSQRLLYDFGQNFAGIIYAEMEGTEGQSIVFRHSEILKEGEVFTKALRTAKAQVVYICKNGKQSYHPTMTYMGFRYVEVRGIKAENIKLFAYVLSSDMEETGDFFCSDSRLNQLQQNIKWSGISNFVDIPTDCPQRDERMGWTGDIAVFAKTACFNFDMSRFLNKWLKDLASEQEEDGALPMTCPKAFDNWKKRVTGCWGDACVLVPWAEYLARGNIEILRTNYPMMKSFLAGCERRAGMLSFGKHKYIWSLPFQFGDWCAPGEDFIHWLLKGKWVATAYFANSCHIVSQIAKLLGEKEDAAYYENLYHAISEAYVELLCDKSGRLKKEFQTAYVLPLAFSMVHKTAKQVMEKRLNEMLKDVDWSPKTGFPGTPYLLFALADYGERDGAFSTLMNEDGPGWLYAVKSGATTIWERWDAIRWDGSINVGEHGDDGGMVSFNHYANGAVGDFLYRRVAGVEPILGGYKRFRISPVPGGGLTMTSVTLQTPFGILSSKWQICKEEFVLEVKVPVSTTCEVVLPSGERQELVSGKYILKEPFVGGNNYG